MIPPPSISLFDGDGVVVVQEDEADFACLEGEGGEGALFGELAWEVGGSYQLDERVGWGGGADGDLEAVVDEGVVEAIGGPIAVPGFEGGGGVRVELACAAVPFGVDCGGGEESAADKIV